MVTVFERFTAGKVFGLQLGKTWKDSQGYLLLMTRKL